MEDGGHFLFPDLGLRPGPAVVAGCGRPNRRVGGRDAGAGRPVPAAPLAGRRSSPAGLQRRPGRRGPEEQNGGGAVAGSRSSGADHR